MVDATASLRACLVLSCFFRVHPLGGLFLAHAEAVVVVLAR